MTKASRTCSIIFGVGAFYEIYTKSIPYIDYTMDIYVDGNSDSSNDYNYNYKCERCSRHNKKPTP